ncbi:MAG: hypothetical protein ACJ76X_11170 [Solirubrobacteraceae bacterium]
MRRTLPLVARYADACNFLERLGHGTLEERFAALERECHRIGRDPETIVKTTFSALDTTDYEPAADRLERLASLGVDLAIVSVPEPWDDAAYRMLASLADHAATLGRHRPLTT